MTGAATGRWYLSVCFPELTKQHLHEIENDLIAGHYHFHGSPPAMQFRNTKVARDQRRV
jgi:hypothetical protein